MRSSLLLVLPVPFMRDGGALLFEKQACNGLGRWADNFDHIVLACPAIDRDTTLQRFSWSWQDMSDLPCRDRIDAVPLPAAYRVAEFARVLPRTRKLLQLKIDECDYLSFAISGLIGDWASVACVEAKRSGRKYSVWTDNVAHAFLRAEARAASWRRRLKVFLYAPATKRYHEYLIKHCALGLFHGQDCYSAYSRLCEEPHLVHDVHTKKRDEIDAEVLESKVQRCASGNVLRLCYVGRATGIKGPLDWIRVVYEVHCAGVPIQATWIGDGDMLGEMRRLTEELGISERIHFHGFVDSQQEILTALRASDILLFCHKAAESPRNLVEALVSGCPILGYSSPYVEDLVRRHGGGLFTPQDDIVALAEKVKYLHAHRGDLCELIRAAARSGKLYNDESVFRHRSDLIKRYLGNRRK
jgi:glycosyltransferase involved in cell wall biosynthesis